MNNLIPTININGVDYPLRFSAFVMRNFSKRYNGIQNMENALKGEEYEILDECFYILSQMMEAGAAYAKIVKMEHPEPLSYDDLYQLCGVEDIANIQKVIFEVMSTDNERNVEVEPEKNLKTT